MIISGVRLTNVGYVVDTPTIITTNLQLHLDAGNTTSYPGSGSTWTDLVGSMAFTLSGSPTYSSSNGGYLTFVPASSQYAFSSTSLSNLSNWTVEVWHYFTGVSGSDTGGSGACIVTETYPGTNSRINYSLGNDSSGTVTDLQSGFFDGSWRNTPSGYTLGTNAWYHIVGTYDGATNKLYVNNSLAQSAAYTGTSTSSGGGIRLMRRWDNTDYWGGNLSVVRIYNTAFTTAQINQNFNAQRGRFGI